MKETVLEFKIGDKKFGIPTKFVKNLFEIENVKKVYGMPEYVVGLVIPIPIYLINIKGLL